MRRAARGVRAARRALAVLAVVAVGTGAGWTQTSGGPFAHYLRLDWEVTKGRRGQALVSGSLYNDYGFPAVRVQLLVEGVDASGQTINETVVYIDREVPARGRASFEAAVPARGGAYRVTVHFFDWLVAPRRESP